MFLKRDTLSLMLGGIIKYSLITRICQQYNNLEVHQTASLFFLTIIVNFMEKYATL